MSKGTTHTPTMRLRTMAALAGLAAGFGLAADASAISIVKLRTNYDAWESVLMPVRNEMGEITGTEIRPVTGQGVTVGIIEAAQPNLDHIAFEGLDFRRIWYPFEAPDSAPDAISTVRRDLLPRTDGGALRFPVELHRHATAVAGAIAARNENLFGEFSAFGPVTGIAPDVDLLTGALITGTDPFDGGFQNVTPEAIMFTLAAMTDVDLDNDGEGDFIEPLAEWYGVEPWTPADVINVSFGSVQGRSERSGEDEFARAANIIVSRTNTTIIAAVGDSAQEAFLEELEEDEGSIASPASGYNTIAVGRTGSGTNIEDRQEDSGIGPIPIFNWLSGNRDGDQYLVNPQTGEDYDDIELMDAEDPREGPPIFFPTGTDESPTGQRVAIDILAPGTMITLPANQLNGPQELSNTDVWDGWSGTSFASAIVTGAAALMHEYGREWGVSTDPVVIRAVLLNSAEKPSGWNNGSTEGDDPLIQTSTDEALDEELGAGVIDFRRLLIQYTATAGGYRDITQANASVLQNFRPVFRRDPAIVFPYLRDPDDEMPDPETLPGGTNYTPRNPQLNDFNRYTEDGDFGAREYFFTTPEFATITGYSDPTAQTGAPSRSRPTSPGATASPEAGPAEGTDVGPGWQNFAQPLGNGGRFSGLFPGDGGIDRTGGTFGGGGGGINRPGGSIPSGIGGGESPGGGGGGGAGSGAGDGGGGSLRPCAGASETNCIRAGWDIGRLGLGFLDLPIGLVPEGTDITATLVWNRTENISNEALENLLNGVISQDAPPPPASTAPAATPEINQPDQAGEANEIDAMGPPPRGYTRETTIWPGLRPNRQLIPLVMAGETLRSAAPVFVDLDRDKDGANDNPGVLLDTCFISLETIALAPSGVPLQDANDSYDPLQIDLDMDGCGPPCDPDDDMAGIGAQGDEDECNPNDPSGGPTTFFDSERMRRLTDAYYSTAVDELNVDPVAFSGVVALRVGTVQTGFRFATGVLLNDRRLLTAAHVFDSDNNGFSDVNPNQVTILFPTFGRNNMVVQYGTAAEIDIHPSFNFVGDRALDPEGGEVVENGRDDIAIVTVRGDTFSDFADQTNASGLTPYDGSTLQFYEIFEGTPPDVGAQEVFISGYGESGDGRFGIPMDLSVPEEEWPIGFVPAGGRPNDAIPQPNLRLGKNVIDFYPNIDDDDDPTSEMMEAYVFDFDDPDNPSVGGLGAGTLGNRIETMITFGDSGSPAFFHFDANLDGNVDPGELQLFGINTNASVAAGQETLATFGSQGQGAIAGAYTGTDADGNLRFITAILNQQPPQPPGRLIYSSDRNHFRAQTAFKFDNLNLELRRQRFDGSDDEVVAQSAAASNVEHVFAQNLERSGRYYLRISWAGPEFDWGGFQFTGRVPFRRVQPIAAGAVDQNLTIDDIEDFFPSEVKYGLAWWADIPFNRTFERSAGGLRAESAMMLMGDMNDDLAVNSTDLAMILARWGTPGPIGDLDQSGTVDASDLLVLLQNLNR